MSTQGRYLFAVATGLDASALEGHEGLGGRPLDVVEHQGLQAVVCDVDLDEFGEEPVRRNLEQLSWVEKVARTHDSVVRAVAARSTVAPMRLVTVCLDDESVVRRLEQWEEPLRAALGRVAGCHEWSVKAFVPVGGREPVAATDVVAPSGTAYLQRKREQRGHREAVDKKAAETAEALHLALSARSRASRLLAPQDPQLTGRSERMILNGAYLLPESDEGLFHQLVTDLRGRHHDTLIEVAGPWAPYSFAVLEAPG
jgi:hypothetical protein